MPRLEKWSCCFTDAENPYLAPECRTIRLQGKVYGHPSFDDGSDVVTSRIVKTEGRTITTYSGSVYVLGEVEPGYREWLAKNRPNWDPENPITMK
jgi:hypothetical protein